MQQRNYWDGGSGAILKAWYLFFYVELPFIICWPCGEECMKIVNTESGRVDSVPVKGSIEFGCGIGPKASFLVDGKNMAVLSQSKDKP